MAVLSTLRDTLVAFVVALFILGAALVAGLALTGYVAYRLARVAGREFWHGLQILGWSGFIP